jgi:hypothetical protein
MKRGGCVLITQPQAMQRARNVCGGEGEIVEQQTRALGNPYSSFSSSSSSLCIRRGFNKNSTLGSAVHTRFKKRHEVPYGTEAGRFNVHTDPHFGSEHGYIKTRDRVQDLKNGMWYRTVPWRVELYTDPYVSDPDSFFVFFFYFFFFNKSIILKCIC